MSFDLPKSAIEQLKGFILLCRTKPEIIHKPELAFFREFLQSFGATLPPPPPQEEKAEAPPKEAQKEEAAGEEVAIMKTTYFLSTHNASTRIQCIYAPTMYLFIPNTDHNFFYVNRFKGYIGCFYAAFALGFFLQFYYVEKYLFL